MRAKEVLKVLQFQEEINKTLKEKGIDTNIHIVFINSGEKKIIYTKYEYYQAFELIVFIKENGEQVPVFIEEIKQII